PAGVDIIASSTSCGLMLKHDYSHLLDIPGAEPVGSRTYDICEYLWMLHEAGDLDLTFEPLDTRVLYHAPCHLKSHGMGYPATRRVPRIRWKSSRGPMATVSLVLVSHSLQLAEGARELAAQMTQGKVKIAVAGGTADGRLGTDANAIVAAIQEVRSADGVLI